MEKFMHVKPTKEYEDQAIEYIKEFYEYDSQIEGVGGLHRYLNDYDGWLLKLDEDRRVVPDNKRVPTETFFLVRKSDNKIVGMLSLRLILNERFKRFGGNIGYSIRPTERQKGYNKVNLYLGLLCCKQHDIKEVLMDCDKDNFGSAKTIQTLGGKLAREYFEEDLQCTVQDYSIDVIDSIKNNSEVYEPRIEHIVFRNYDEKEYDFVYEIKKNAYKKYVEECWGTWNESLQKVYFKNFIDTYCDDLCIIQFDGCDVGFYNGTVLDNGAYEIGNVCIIPEYQGRGIGTQVLKNIIELHQEQDLYIQYFKQNPVGKLYSRLGFVLSGESDFHFQMLKKSLNKSFSTHKSLK